MGITEDKVAFANCSDTSKAAARSLTTAKSIREQVFDYIALQRTFGATCDEVEVALGLSHQTTSARIWELRGNPAGRVVRVQDTGARRKTRTGRRAAIYIVRKELR